MQIKTEYEQLIKDLNKLDEKTIQKALGAGLTASAKPVKLSIGGLTPIETGILKGSLSHRTLTKKQKAMIGLGGEDRAVSVGLIKQTAWVKLRKKIDKITLSALVSILDQGAKPHTITSKKPGGFLKLFGGQMVKSVNHPGVQGSNFMQTAFDSSASGVESQFFNGLRRYLDKHAA